MRRTPFQQFADALGMYAYLAAMGGLRYWPAVRQAGIDEQVLPVESDDGFEAEALVGDTASYEYDVARERIPV